MSVITPLRTYPFPFTVLVPDYPEFELTSANVPDFPPTGKIVRWDVRNVETDPAKYGMARLGPSGTVVEEPSGGPPSTIVGNAIHMTAGGSFAFQRETERIDFEDTEWDTLILIATKGKVVTFTGTVSVWIPEGQTL